MPAPISIPTAIIQNEMICRSSSVTARASVMPTAARRFPERAVAGELSRFSPKMKSTAATIYATAIAESRKSSIRLFGLPLLEHLEHPVRHDEPAENIGGAKHDGDEAEDVQQRRVGRAGNEHCS